MVQVLFVCLGNICRSPMAEAIMRHLVARAGLMHEITVESVGTGDWHVGEPAHPRTRAILRQYAIPCTGSARQITHGAITGADYLVAMDSDNVAAVQRLDTSAAACAKLRRLLEFGPDVGTLDVPDPYYTGDFEAVYQLVLNGCHGLLDHIRAEQKL